MQTEEEERLLPGEEMDETSLNPTPVDTQYVYIIGAVF